MLMKCKNIVSRNIAHQICENYSFLENTNERHKDTRGTQRHRRDTTTQEGHKDTKGTQRHRRDTKTQEGHKDIERTQRHRTDTKT